MRRIPFAGNANGVHDNLVDTTESESPRAGGRADGQVFGALPHHERGDDARTGMQRILTDALTGKNIPPHEVEFFVNRLMVFFTASDARRFGQWEHTSWWDFVRAEGKSDEYKRVDRHGLTRSLVAAKETVATTRTIGNMAEAFVMNIMQRGNDGALDRVLNAPTNEAWVDPWLHPPARAGRARSAARRSSGCACARGRIDAASVRDRAGGAARSRPTGSSARCPSSARGACGPPRC